MTTTHASCTHPKTKAARAACRAGKGVGPTVKAERSPAADEGVSIRQPLGRSPITNKLYLSGHCAVGNHDRCAGVYAGVSCSCTCDHAQ